MGRDVGWIIDIERNCPMENGEIRDYLMAARAVTLRKVQQTLKELNDSFMAMEKLSYDTRQMDAAENIGFELSAERSKVAEARTLLLNEIDRQLTCLKTRMDMAGVKAR